jgi:hypothetical protein
MLASEVGEIRISHYAYTHLKVDHWYKMKIKRIGIERLLPIIITVVSVLLYQTLWRVDLIHWAVERLLALKEMGLLVIVLYTLLLLILHEGLHAMGFIVFGHVSWKAI